MFGHDDNTASQHTADDGILTGSDESPTSTAPAVNQPGDDTQSTHNFAAPTTTDQLASSDIGATAITNDLLVIKQELLQQLSPLIDHLDQSPEEKFRTTMMMIQATDDQKLIKQAYEAAKRITDDKTRAQALLDIVNEINYFTQQQAH
ncbi:MAG: hypothetical protein NVS1B7_2010 [Candidatus Saccharimonadales bacterium]